MRFSADHLRLPAHAQHQRDVRPIYIGIEQADLVSHLRERDGQVHRQRGLAHAALARTHGNDGIDSRQRLRPRRRLARDETAYVRSKDHTPRINQDGSNTRLYRAPTGLELPRFFSRAALNELGDLFLGYSEKRKR